MAGSLNMNRCRLVHAVRKHLERIPLHHFFLSLSQTFEAIPRAIVDDGIVWDNEFFFCGATRVALSVCAMLFLGLT